MKTEESNKKVLLLASVASMIQQFNMRNIGILQRMGYTVEVGCNFEKGNTCPKEQIYRLQEELKRLGVKGHQIDFARNVFQFKENQRAYKELKTLLREGDFCMIHCHSPIGGVLGRLAGHKYHVRTIYTAHGFHFYKGAPLKNWVLFYPVEQFLSRWTDILITINREDYNLAVRKMHAKKVEYVPGVGVDTEYHACEDTSRKQKRTELGIPEDAFLVTSAAEFIDRKNQITVVRAMEQLRDKNIYYLMCGIGEKRGELEQYVAERNLQHIKFAGFRRDIHDILQASDCFVLSSIQEGLSVALMEAMAEGVPIVCSRIRGNVDLVRQGREGYLVSATDIEGYRDAFLALYAKKEKTPADFIKMGENARTRAGEFGKERVDAMMEEIYRQGVEGKL